MAQLTYAGQQLLVPSGPILDWLDRFYPPGRLSALAPNWDGYSSFYDAPFPRPRLNTLYMPHGAARWGHMLALCGDTEKQEIEKASQSGPSSADIPELYFATEHSDLRETTDAAVKDQQITLAAHMHCLEPQLIANYDAALSDRLWLLTLVDSRYFWHQTATDGLTDFSKTTTWIDLWAALEGACGIGSFVSDDVDSEWQQPDPSLFNRSSHNLAVVMEQALRSCGQWLWPNLRTLTWYRRNWTAARDATLPLFEQPQARQAGDWGNPITVPASVKVSFPVVRQYVPQLDDERQEIEITRSDLQLDADALGIEWWELTTAAKPIRSTCYADYTGGGVSPDNEAALLELADVIAKHYYRRRALCQSLRLAIVDDSARPLFDATEYALGAPTGDPAPDHLDISTLYLPIARNADEDLVAQQTNQTVFATTHRFGKTAEEIAPGATGNVTVYNDASTSSGLTVSGTYDWGEGADSIAADGEVWIDYYHEDNKWHIKVPPAVDAELQWARTITNWQFNSGDWKVEAKDIDDTPERTGTNVTGSSFDIYIPPVVDGHPNLVSGINICYMIDGDGQKICVSDVLDAKIGSVRMWCGAEAAVPSGWAKMDGIANAVGNGGSGLSMLDGESRRRFARHADNDGEIGNTGGNESHDHTEHDAGDIDDHGPLDTGLTGIGWTTPTGGTHEHTISGDGGHSHTADTCGTGISGTIASGATDSNFTGIGNHTGEQTCTDGNHVHSVTTGEGGHSHSINEGAADIPSHAGDVTASSVVNQHDSGSISSTGGHSHTTCSGAADIQDHSGLAAATHATDITINDTVAGENTDDDPYEHVHTLDIDYTGIDEGEGDTINAVTGVSVEAAWNAASPGVPHDAHTHAVSDGGHAHNLPTMTHTDDGHCHSIAASGSHDHETPALTHDPHCHSFSTLTHADNGHTHTMPSGGTHSHSITGDATHNHAIPELEHSDPGHIHGLTGVSVTLSDPGHSHPVSGTGTHGHAVSGGGHTHDVDSNDTEHDHTMGDLAHSGELAHDLANHTPLYLGLMFIERLDNSADGVS